MKEGKILHEQFTWTPLHLIPNTPPRKPDNRMPYLWLSRLRDELFLVNNTGEPLDFVGVTIGGFISADDDIAPLKNKDKYAYQYTDVPNDTAVKIEEYDGFYDLDYVLQVSLEIKSSKFGTLNITSPAEKGGIKRNCVLLWETGEAGKHTKITKTI